MNFFMNSSIYILGLVLQWLKEEGGAVGMEERNKLKSDALYQTIDNSNSFYWYIYFILFTKGIVHCICHMQRLSHNWAGVSFLFRW